jgi:hypothetical protein
MKEMKQISSRVARFTLIQHTKPGKNKPNDYKNIPNCHEKYPIAVK